MSEQSPQHICQPDVETMHGRNWTCPECGTGWVPHAQVRGYRMTQWEWFVHTGPRSGEHISVRRSTRSGEPRTEVVWQGHDPVIYGPGGVDTDLPPIRLRSPQHNALGRFTERARHVLALARAEAEGSNHNSIGTEHLLLGLMSEREGLAAKVLSRHQLTPGHVQRTIEPATGEGGVPMVGQMGLTRSAERAIDLALVESHGLGHGYIGTEHLLLGLTREDRGIALLQSANIEPKTVRAEIIQATTLPGEARGD